LEIEVTFHGKEAATLKKKLLRRLKIEVIHLWRDMADILNETEILIGY